MCIIQLKVILLGGVLSIISLAAKADDEWMNLKNCLPGSNAHQQLYATDFKWGYTVDELLHKWHEVYEGPKRLAKRAYWDSNLQKIVLPYDQSRGGHVTISTPFIKGVKTTIEQALALKVIEGVFFPDMGHSHLLIPDQKYEKWNRRFEINQMSQLYEAMFTDQDTLYVYHTAEQLKFLDDKQNVQPDEYSQFRHKTRNIIASHQANSSIRFGQNPDSPANTLNGLSGFKWWGGGFNLSANQEGCFAYQMDGKTYYYDISLYDLSYPEGQGVWRL